MQGLELSEILIRIFTAIVTGGVIGLEREIKNKPAGFITHIVLCVGAAVIAIIQLKLTYQSIAIMRVNPDLAAGMKVDNGRLIAQVISGVGFLGAGTIIQNKGSVKGITTAATLWLTACLGIAVGLGYYVLALGTAAVATSMILILKKIELHHIEKRMKKKIQIIYVADPAVETKIKNYLLTKRIKIRGKNFLSEIYNGEETERKTIFTLMVPKFINIASMVDEMKKMDDVINVINL
jgi:putative Mg2+ transporter-C (MgtC) family protein